MEITTLFFFCVILTQQCFVLAYGHTSRRHDITNECQNCDQRHACEMDTFCKTSGNALTVRFEPKCAECVCTPLVVCLLRSEGGDVREHTKRQLDKFDRETVFNDLGDGLYSVNIIRGDLFYNLTGFCEVSNQDQVDKARVVVYLTIFGCVFFTTIVVVGMFRFYKNQDQSD